MEHSNAYGRILSQLDEKRLIASIKLYDLRMKEVDSIMTRLNSYKSIISQLSPQGMKIEEEL